MESLTCNFQCFCLNIKMPFQKMFDTVFMIQIHLTCRIQGLKDFLGHRFQASKIFLNDFQCLKNHADSGVSMRDTAEVYMTPRSQSSRCHDLGCF